MQIYDTTSKVKLRKFGSKIPVVNVVKTRKKLRKTLLKFFFSSRKAHCVMLNVGLTNYGHMQAKSRIDIRDLDVKA